MALLSGEDGERPVLPPRPLVPYDLNRPYPLQPGDWVSIRVLGDEELNCDVPIPPDGMLEVWKSEAKIGGSRRTVKAEGRTTVELQDDLAKVYLEVRSTARPYVIVTIQKAVERTVYFVGAVQSKEGKLPLPANRRLTLMRAIQEAGGPAEDADLSRVQISRKDPATGGEVSGLGAIDLWAVEEAGAYDRDPPLEPNDIIRVPRLGHVTILGEVATPGRYLCRRGMRLVDLFGIAGGLKEFAKLRDVRVVRGEGTGKDRLFRIDAQAIFDGTGQDFLLRPGDRVHVDERIL